MQAAKALVQRMTREKACLTGMRHSMDWRSRCIRVEIRLLCLWLCKLNQSDSLYVMRKRARSVVVVRKEVEEAKGSMKKGVAGQAPVKCLFYHSNTWWLVQTTSCRFVAEEQRRETHILPR